MAANKGGHSGLFKPGHKRLGGRQKGTPNKKTQALIDILDSLKFDPVRKIYELLPSLDEWQQTQVCLDLISYLYPKRKAVEHTGADGEAIGIAITDEHKSEISKLNREQMEKERK